MAQPTMSTPTMADYLQGRRTYGKGSVQTNEPPPPTRDDALWDMQEELNRRWYADQARGAVAGIANPFGLTGWVASSLSPERGGAFQEALERWDNNAPVAASMATFLGPGYGAVRGLSRLIGADPRLMLPVLGGAGHTIGSIRESRVGRERTLTDEERGREYGAAGY